jgi:hypothetical protein
MGMPADERADLRLARARDGALGELAAQRRGVEDPQGEPDALDERPQVLAAGIGQGAGADRGLLDGSAERSSTAPRLRGCSTTGATVTPCSVGMTMSWGSIHSTGPNINSTSGASSPGRVRAKAAASMTLELIIPVRRVSQRTRLAGDSTAASDSGRLIRARIGAAT